MAGDPLTPLQAEVLFTIYQDITAAEPEPRDKVRLIGLLLHLICKHEGRAIPPAYLHDIISQCGHTLIKHRMDAELESGAVILGLMEMQREREDAA